MLVVEKVCERQGTGTDGLKPTGSSVMVPLYNMGKSKDGHDRNADRFDSERTAVDMDTKRLIRTQVTVLSRSSTYSALYIGRTSL